MLFRFVEVVHFLVDTAASAQASCSSACLEFSFQTGPRRTLGTHSKQHGTSSSGRQGSLHPKRTAASPGCCPRMPEPFQRLSMDHMGGFRASGGHMLGDVRFSDFKKSGHRRLFVLFLIETSFPCAQNTMAAPPLIPLQCC